MSAKSYGLLDLTNFNWLVIWVCSLLLWSCVSNCFPEFFMSVRACSWNIFNFHFFRIFKAHVLPSCTFKSFLLGINAILKHSAMLWCMVIFKLCYCCVVCLHCHLLLRYQSIPTVTITTTLNTKLHRHVSTTTKIFVTKCCFIAHFWILLLLHRLFVLSLVVGFSEYSNNNNHHNNM